MIQQPENNPVNNGEENQMNQREDNARGNVYQKEALSGSGIKRKSFAQMKQNRKQERPQAPLGQLPAQDIGPGHFETAGDTHPRQKGVMGAGHSTWNRSNELPDAVVTLLA